LVDISFLFLDLFGLMRLSYVLLFLNALKIRRRY
jgi:hypothetical protein